MKKLKVDEVVIDGKTYVPKDSQPTSNFITRWIPVSDFNLILAVASETELKPFNMLREGEKFRFFSDSDTITRTAQQVGKMEIYAPPDGSNTIGHSKAGGEECFIKSDFLVMIIKNR